MGELPISHPWEIRASFLHPVVFRPGQSPAEGLVCCPEIKNKPKHTPQAGADLSFPLISLGQCQEWFQLGVPLVPQGQTIGGSELIPHKNKALTA